MTLLSHRMNKLQMDFSKSKKPELKGYILYASVVQYPEQGTTKGCRNDQWFAVSDIRQEGKFKGTSQVNLWVSRISLHYIVMLTTWFYEKKRQICFKSPVIT